MPLITERPNDSSVSIRFETALPPRSLISDSTNSALPMGVHALSLQPREISVIARARRTVRNFSKRSPQTASPAAHGADTRGVAGHPDGNRLSLSVGVFAAQRRAYDFHGRV
jgi:hypothetical protein